MSNFNAFSMPDLRVTQAWFDKCRELGIDELAEAMRLISPDQLPGFTPNRVGNAETVLLLLTREGMTTVTAASERLATVTNETTRRWSRRRMSGNSASPEAIRQRNFEAARKEAIKAEFHGAPICPDCKNHPSSSYRANIKMRRSKFMIGAWTCPRCSLSILGDE